jgi:hypothetical protein
LIWFSWTHTIVVQSESPCWIIFLMHLKLGSQQSGWLLLHHCYEDREFARGYITTWRIRNEKRRTGFGPSFAKQVSIFNNKLKIYKPAHDTYRMH